MVAAEPKSASVWIIFWKHIIVLCWNCGGALLWAAGKIILPIAGVFAWTIPGLFVVIVLCYVCRALVLHSVERSWAFFLLSVGKWLVGLMVGHLVSYCVENENLGLWTPAADALVPNFAHEPARHRGFMGVAGDFASILVMITRLRAR
jgi:hypothetical protein